MELKTLVLIVEAEAPLRRSLEKFLCRAGYAFRSCGTAREALELAQTLRPLIAIVEYRLPDANGFTLVEKLNRLVPDAAVIVLSQVDAPDAANARVKVRTVLKKPFDLTELEAALHAIGPRLRAIQSEADWKRDSKISGIPRSYIN